MSIYKKVIADLRGKWGYAILFCILFFILAAASFALSILSPLMLILSVPLLFSPAFYTAFRSVRNLIRNKNFEVNGKEHWGYFRSYFRAVMQKALRSLRCVLFTLLVYLAFVSIFSSILSLPGEAIWPGFNAAIEELYEALEAGTIDPMTYLLNSVPLTGFFSVVHAVSLGFAILFYFYLSTRQALFGAMSVHFPMPTFLLGRTCKFRVGYLKRAVPEFNRKYWGMFWPSLVAYVAGFAVTMAISFPLTNSIMGPYAFGIFGGLLGLFLTMPMLLAGIYELGEECAIPFFEERLAAAKEELSAFESSGMNVPGVNLDEVKRSVKAVEDLVNKAKEQQNVVLDSSDELDDIK